MKGAVCIAVMLLISGATLLALMSVWLYKRYQNRPTKTILPSMTDLLDEVERSHGGGTDIVGPPLYGRVEDEIREGNWSWPPTATTPDPAPDSDRTPTPGSAPPRAS